MKSYLSVKQAHARLNGAVSLRKLYAMVEGKKIRHSRAFGKILIDEHHLSQLLEAGEILADDDVTGGGKPAR